MMHDSLQLHTGDVTFQGDPDISSCLSTLEVLNPKLRSLPRLMTTLPPVPSVRSDAKPIKARKLNEYSASFEVVATAIGTYRVALLNYELSNTEERGANARALDKSVKELERIFDIYDGLAEVSRQLLGVFLKELYFEGSKGKNKAEGSHAVDKAAPSRDASCSNGDEEVRGGE